MDEEDAMQHCRRAGCALVGLVCLSLMLPAIALAQDGAIAGTVRDQQGQVVPGATVEVTSPALIGVRTGVSDERGQYRITNLPVGTYTVSFSLPGFNRMERDNVVLTSGFTAPVNVALSVGDLTETIIVTGEAPTVDVQNARQAITFSGEDLADLPTGRDINSLLALTPGITHPYSPGTLQGVCSGGVGVFCNPGIQGFNVGSESGGAQSAQGRIMVDGQVVNAGASLPIVGMTGGYTADIANAQEITIQLSGALGESETGGASINIIPRTGGNRYAGNYNTTYTTNRWFAKNDGAYENINIQNLVQRVHDVSGAFGGPILRDRLWFYSVLRDQGKEQIPGPAGAVFWPNLHEGKWGYNYQPNRDLPRVRYTNTWRNANTRLTLQLTPRNKFNIFWDEQDFCQDPCGGVVSVFTSPESWWSVQSKPNRLQQVSWTNPLTNRILLEAGLSITAQHYRTDMHREFENPRQIPRITENGNTVGMDDVSPRVNNVAGGGFTNLTSGSLNSQMSPGGAEHRNSDNYRMRASASYVTGAHNAKLGYEGAVYTQVTTNQANDLRMTYLYTQPSIFQCNPANPALNNCGNTHLGNQFVGPQFPDDPDNLLRRPRPNQVQINTGRGQVHERVQYSAFYVQDQWTFDRMTLNGALRYDYATSRYGSTCVGPDAFVPAAQAYCTGEHSGVSFHDLSPRWGAVYDVLGTGRTAVKFNMGKYLGQAAIGAGVFSNANPARRTVNQVTVNWNDLNGDRIVDCDILGMLPDRSASGECSGFTGGSDTLRFGKNPFVLDAEGNLPGLGLTQCGLTFGVLPEVIEYCNEYGESLISGWGRRQYQWQIGLGVQHEILPRLSVEVTYNRRMTNNVLVTDRLGEGCDRFLADVDVATCNQMYLDFDHPDYAFYSFIAPEDPNLPGGGGYRITGLSTPNASFGGGPQAQTFMDTRKSSWNGVDTNFVWRGPRGLRVNGGTSTGRSNLNTCFAQLDTPNVKGREGLPYQDGCDSRNPWNTRVNGTVAYVIPWVDVLVSTVFQGFRGPQRSAILQNIDKSEVIWEPSSAFRVGDQCTGAAEGSGTGCFGASRNADTTTINLLNANELFGERVMLFDLKLAKNIRFANRRATIGVDVFNLFNSDAINSYQNNYVIPDPENNVVNNWGQPTGLVPPRFAQLSLQFSF
jgi:hypothetical protein